MSRNGASAQRTGRQGAEPAAAGRATKRGKRGRKRRGGGGGEAVRLTSQSTGRSAMQETRAWLLERHGPVCAYCGNEYSARKMTLDHVAPRRGQSAYDRRDNLVLACPACNMAKRDLAPLAFLLASRQRALNLVRYGEHLSHGLLEMAKSLVPEGALQTLNGSNGRRERFSDTGDFGESPYSD